MSENDSKADVNPVVVNPEIRFAQAIGTLNAPDRAKQYSKQRGRADNEELLRSLNELWKEKRILDAAVRDRDRQLDELHGKLKERDELIVALKKYLRSKWVGYLIAALVSAGVAVAWEIGMLFAPIALRWLGVN